MSNGVVSRFLAAKAVKWDIFNVKRCALTIFWPQKPWNETFSTWNGVLSQFFAAKTDFLNWTGLQFAHPTETHLVSVFWTVLVNVNVGSSLRERKVCECVTVRRPGRVGDCRNAKLSLFVFVLVWVYFEHERFESGFHDLKFVCQSFTTRDLFHQQNRKGKIVMTKTIRYKGLVFVFGTWNGYDFWRRSWGLPCSSKSLKFVFLKSYWGNETHVRGKLKPANSQTNKAAEVDSSSTHLFKRKGGWVPCVDQIQKCVTAP
jgi:hypothetical protein